MNAKELAEAIEIVERTSIECDLDGKKFWSKQMDKLRSLLEGMAPRYRPPQPSDDGRWCFLEQFHDYEPCPYKIVQHDNDVWWCVPLRGTKKFRLTGGIWPCERPEGGGE